jgi:para-nitrobenzyl esterase
MANDISTAATGTGPIVETVSGKLRGSLDNDIHTFKGVPYGASTAGHNRFRSPQPPPAWSGVREALAYRGRAWQCRAVRRAGQCLRPYSAPPTRRRKPRTA